MLRLVAGMVLVLGGMAGPALAQEVDCSVAEAQMELTFCAEQDWMAADAELNDAYKAAMAVMKRIDATLGEGKNAEGYLRQAQRDWVAFRDNACAAEAYPMHGGSAEPMLIYGCRARLTEERTLGLYYITEIGEGG
jgi:uncharacterized protein YecT (DUF1311 family)